MTDRRAESDAARTATAAAASSHSLIPGTVNARDLGNLQATQSWTAPRRVIRSDSPERLGAAGTRRLIDLGISEIIDLRVPGEGRSYQVPERVHVHQIPLLAGAFASLGALGAGQLSGQVELPSLAQLYRGMLADSADAFATIARAVIDSEGCLLIHCTAGKDRTGVAVGVLLDAVGVRTEAIVADYSQSTANLSGRWSDTMMRRIEEMGVPGSAQLRALVCTAPAQAMEETLGWLTEEFGGGRRYLRAAGLGEDELAELDHRLLTD